MENILSRVTGGSSSIIDGTLASTIPGECVSAESSWGAVWPPSQSRGQWVVSRQHGGLSALCRWQHFDADLSSTSVLSVSSPEAFGFLSENPGPITFQASGSSLAEVVLGLKGLTVPVGETLSVIGGDIELTSVQFPDLPTVASRLQAPGGRVNIVGVASAGEAVLSVSGIEVDTFDQLGRIGVGEGSLISVSGDRGGTVVIRGGSLATGEGSLILSNTLSSMSGAAIGIDIHVTDDLLISGSILQSATAGDGDAGNVLVSAGRDASLVNALIDTRSFTFLGRGGATTLVAPDLTLDNTVIDASTTGTGQGGTVTIQGERFVAENETLITSAPFSSGMGGAISIETTESIVFRGGSDILNGPVELDEPAELGDAGDVSIRSPVVQLTGEGFISTNTNGAGNGGDISIEADRLTIDGGFGLTSTGAAGQGGNMTIVAAESVVISSESDSVRSGISTGTLGDGNAGHITITSRVVVLDRANISAFTSDVILPNNNGNAGDILIDVDELTLRNDAIISGGTNGETTAGAGGSVTILARKGVDIDGDFSAILNGVESSQGAGSITIRTPRLAVTGGGLIESNTFGAGSGGIIDIEVVDLHLQGGGGISSLTTGSGRGGIIVVSASGSISIQGTGVEGESSGIATISSSTGTAGSVQMRTPLFSMDQGVISAGTLDVGAASDIVVETDELRMTNGALIDSSTLGTGSAGSVTIRGLGGVGSVARAIRLTNSTLRTRATSDGTGGNIQINAADVTLDRATISATTSGIGNAGNITVADVDTFQSDNSTVTTEAMQADGGNIQVTAQTMIRLRDSEITATVGGGDQTVGGNITTNSEFVILENSRIVANAFEGRGGNIQIAAEAFLADANSAVSASAALGVDGMVSIDTFNELSETVTPLPGNFEGATTLLRERCAGRLRGQGTGRFILAGRDRPPNSPGGVLSSPLPREDMPELAGTLVITDASRQAPRGTHHPEVHRQPWYCDG